MLDKFIETINSLNYRLDWNEYFMSLAFLDH